MSSRDGRDGPTGDSNPVTGFRDALFGDEVGLALFLGGLCVTWLTWHVGFFITDTYAIANTLVNVAGGHLSVERIEYSLTLGSQPGLHVVDGRLYGRNYGQVFLALPVYYGLELAGRVVDLRLLLPGMWSLLVLAFVRQMGTVTGHRRIALRAGSLVAVVLFLASLLVAPPFEDDPTGIVALQVVSTAAVAATGVSLYRAVRLHCERSVAVAAGAGVVVATPLWFWASVPKRHALTALAVAVLLFAFASSREGGRLRLRALGYIVAGLVAWVHVFEGIALLLTYGTADLITARSTGLREIVTVILVLMLAFGPFVATNALVSGDPLKPPRLTPGFEPDRDQGVELGPGGAVLRTDESSRDDDGGGETYESGGNESGTSGRSGSGNEADSGDGTTSPRISEAIGRAVRQGKPYVKQTVASLDTAPTRLYHTYVRSGYIDFNVRYGPNQQEPIELTLLESVPTFGTLVAGIAFGLVRFRRLTPSRLPRNASEAARTVLAVGRRVRSARPTTQTTAFALGIVVCFGTIYLSFLPTFSQITVRYLLPTVPALGYLVARTTPVRRVVRERGRSVVVAYALLVVIGATLVVVGFPRIDPAIGEAMQLHALVNLGTATVAGGLLTGDALGVNVGDRVLAAGLALPAAATTVLVGFMQLAYFEYGVYAIPLVRPIAESLALLS